MLAHALLRHHRHAVVQPEQLEVADRDLARQAVNNSNIVPAGTVKKVGDTVVLGAAGGLAINEGTISVNAAGKGTVKAACISPRR